MKCLVTYSQSTNTKKTQNKDSAFIPSPFVTYVDTTTVVISSNKCFNPQKFFRLQFIFAMEKSGLRTIALRTIRAVNKNWLRVEFSIL